MRLREVLPLVAVVVPAALGAQAAPKIDTMMTAREYRDAGIAKLSVAERAALERWLGRRLARPSAVGPRPSAAEGGSPRAARPGSVVSVTSLLGGGGFVVLADGTMWEVWVSDQTASAAWRAGDPLLVRAQPAPPEARYTLRFENGRTRSAASVRYAGVAQPSAVAIGRDRQSVAPAAAQTVIVREPVYVPVPTYEYYPYPYYPARSHARRPGWPDDRERPAPPTSAVGQRRPVPTLPAPPTMAPPPAMSPAPRP